MVKDKIILRSLLLFLLSFFPLTMISLTTAIATPVIMSAGIKSINLATIDDQPSIAVFFTEPEVFTLEALENQFTLEKIEGYNYEFNRYTYTPVESGSWKLSKEGSYLYYTPLKPGQYSVKPKDYPNNKKSFNDTHIYVGAAAEVVNILGKGPVMPLTHHSLPIESVGVKAVDIEFFHITNPAHFLEGYYLGQTIDRWDLDEISRNYLEPAAIFRYEMPKETDLYKKSEHRIPVDKNITSGAYLVAVSPAGQVYKTLDTRILFITDIGMHVHRYPNETLVLAHHFSSLNPVTNGQLEVWRPSNKTFEILSSTCTLKEGSCVIPYPLKQNDLLVLKTEDDLSILPMRETALDLNDFAITGELFQAETAHLYSNRLLYRPGEPIILNALLRDKDGDLLPPQPAEIRIINPEGKTVQTHHLEGSPNGFYQLTFSTLAEDKTGLWQAEFRTDATQKIPNGALRLYIEEFMPERMELQLKADKTQLLLTDPLNYSLTSRYLFDAPAAGNLVKIQTLLQPNKHPFRQHPDWYVGKDSYLEDYLTDYQFEEEMVLNDKGEGTLQFTLPLINQKTSPSQVIQAEINVNVLDGNTSGIHRALKADFWPPHPLPIIRPLFKKDEFGYGQKADFELFSSTLEGELEARELTLALEFYSHWCTWIYNESEGWSCHRNDEAEIHELKTLSTSKEDPIFFSVDPNSWGRYELVLTDIMTGFETRYPFESTWAEGKGGNLPAARPLRLNLTPDKPVYKDNDKVKITIEAPFKGELILFVEGDSLFEKTTHKVKKGKNNLTVKINPNWKRHDLYLTALLLGKNSKEEIVRTLGIIPLPLDRDDRSLQAELLFPEIALPEKEVTITLKVDNPLKNEQLFATISLADQGILNMTPLENRDIFKRFFSQKRYSADIIDYYNRLFANSTKTLLTPQFGGDGEVDEPPQEVNLTEMKTISITSELLTLNEKGDYEFTVLLPDFNGEAKVLATLFSDKRVGEVEKQMTIRAPIVADLITPNFIRVADNNHLALSLHNLSGGDERLEVKLSSDDFTTDFHKTLFLDDKESYNTLIPLALPQFTPQGEVTLSLDANAFSTTRTYRLGTVPYAPKTTYINRSFIPKDQRWQKEGTHFNQMREGISESLLISRYPIIDILNYTDNLFGYPYGCTEQITSQSFPWLFPSHPYLDHEKEALYKKYVAEEEYLDQVPLSYLAWQKDLLHTAINRLLMRQQSNGAFAVWSSAYYNVASSSYVADFLYQTARLTPELIPPQVLDGVTDFLKKAISQKNQQLSTNNDLNDLNNIAYAAWILAREGRLFQADILPLTHYQHEMSPLSRAYLGAAHLLLGNEGLGKTILENVEFANWNRHYGYYYTDVAEIALTLNLFNQLKVGRYYNAPTQQVERLLSQLDERLARRTYLSTQERYALIKLGIELPKDSRPIQLRDSQGETIEVHSGETIDTTTIHSLQGEEDLYFSYQVSGYPLVRESAQTFKADIKRDYKFAGHLGEPVEVTAYNASSHLGKNQLGTLHIGTRILVALTIKPERNITNVLIEDAIPGGFKLVNPNLETDNKDEFYRSFNLDLADQQSKDLTHEEFRFDRYVAALDMEAGKTYTFLYVIEAAIPGEYEIPNTYIEAMYLPDLRASKSYADRPASLMIIGN